MSRLFYCGGMGFLFGLWVNVIVIVNVNVAHNSSLFVLRLDK